MSKRKALAGIFWILDKGAKWKDLPGRFGSKSAARRWFLRRVKEGVFNNILPLIGHLAGQTGGFRLYECFVDGTFSKAKGGGDGIGLTKTGKGVKIMVLAGAKGLPVAATTAPAPGMRAGLSRSSSDLCSQKTLPKGLSETRFMTATSSMSRWH